MPPVAAELLVEFAVRFKLGGILLDLGAIYVNLISFTLTYRNESGLTMTSPTRTGTVGKKYRKAIGE